MKVNHCINGRSVVVRKAVRKEQVKLAEQSERERAHLEEHQKHGYAGYGKTYITVTAPVIPTAPLVRYEVFALCEDMKFL
ncbi:hypothetical protein OESDEN_18182 [Oesophagostomum dentatum]|uniref:Uncharacterized protein n=1 Tax=Oesophagostomum dentatum TaxID=61180 RepID=A0A0B1SE39_OESDE|nr:hypothetical protein OESDEN_18182 [Oesophagostomum dentatum]